MVDVVLFTTEDREHLLLSTSSQLKTLINKNDHRLILAVDGRIDPATLRIIDPDLIVTSWHRRGYIHSIITALKVVNSEFFFWVEDDWDISRITGSSVAESVEFLRSNENTLQIRWSKIAPLEDNATLIRGKFYESGVGFSANPCVCRTSLARKAFDYVLNTARKGSTLGADGFENVVTAWASDSGWVCAVIDPGPVPSIEHLGDLQSTGRQWHMTQSVEITPSGYGYLGARPPFWRRLWMITKLVRKLLTLSIAQLFSDAQYELAFRIAVARRRS